MTSILEYTNQWVAAGIAVIPVRRRDKAPEARLLPTDSTGRHTWEPFIQRLPTNAELAGWFNAPRNYGVVMGWRNLVVIDFDDVGAYLSWRVWATRQGGYTERVLEGTYQVRTARGVHVYVRTVEREMNRKLKNIDIKAQRGYVLGAGSIHPSGAAYTIQQDGLPMLVGSLSDVLPAELLVQQTVAGVSMPNVSPRILSNKVRLGGDLIEVIRNKQRIESYFPTAVQGRGRYLMACCPFHDDKHPSFWIDTDKQICGCFSGCTTKPLDVINLYARLYGISNREAIITMAQL